MLDRDCIDFLQWTLPRMRLRWPGFRKVRGQVCKRISRRMAEVKAPTTAAYRDYLEEHTDEWPVLDSLCRITISRFYRDRGVFEFLEQEILPRLAGTALQRGKPQLRVWCIGCASGEEPYTLALLWHLRLRRHFPDVELAILATDADVLMVERARKGSYAASSLRDLPGALIDEGFILEGRRFRIKDSVKEYVEFLFQDIRQDMPGGAFDLLLCRNLVFTYFDETLQIEMAERLTLRINPGGALVLGTHEQLPEQSRGFLPWPGSPGIYRKNYQQSR